MREQVFKPCDGRHSPGAAETGFTLLELIVSIAIFSIVVGAIYAVLEVGRSDTFNTSQRTETMQNARVALNTMNADAINAGVGYWKGGARMPDGTLERLLFLASETDGTQDWLTPVVPGNNVKTIVDDGANVATDAVTFVYQDNTFNAGHALPVTAINSTSNTVTVSSTTACAQGDLYVYIIDDGTQPALGSLTAIPNGTQLRFSLGDPLGLNNPGSSSTFRVLNPSASLKRITWVTYFVNPDHVLIRRVYGNTARIVGAGVEDNGVGGVVPTNNSGNGVGFVEMPLAYGVQDFQVRYVLENGTTVDDIGSGIDADGNTIPPSANRQNIRQVQVSLRLRSPKNDPKTNEPIEVSINGTFYTPNLVVAERPGADAP